MFEEAASCSVVRGMVACDFKKNPIMYSTFGWSTSTSCTTDSQAFADRFSESSDVDCKMISFLPDHEGRSSCWGRRT